MEKKFRRATLVSNEDCIWRTKDGRRIRLGSMDYTHLNNVIEWARRRVLAYYEQIGKAGSPEEELRLTVKLRSLRRWIERFEMELDRRKRESLNKDGAEKRVETLLEENLRREVEAYTRRR